MNSASCVGRFTHQRRVRRHADRRASPPCARRARQLGQRAIDRFAASPPITICPASCSWPAPRPAFETCAQTSATSASSAPITAAIAPLPAGTAACISRPRSRTRCAPSAATRPGRNQRRVLAQAVAGNCAGAHHRVLPRTPHRNARGEQRRLGEFGRLSCSSGPCPAKAPTGRHRHRSRLRRMSARLRPCAIGQFRQHAERLRTLAGENESKARWAWFTRDDPLRLGARIIRRGGPGEFVCTAAYAETSVRPCATQ
jgi:hypothetical protein